MSNLPFGPTDYSNKTSAAKREAILNLRGKNCKITTGAAWPRGSIPQSDFSRRQK
jgi:hypothetical protein